MNNQENFKSQRKKVWNLDKYSYLCSMIRKRLSQLSVGDVFSVSSNIEVKHIFKTPVGNVIENVPDQWKLGMRIDKVNKCSISAVPVHKIETSLSKVTIPFRDMYKTKFPNIFIQKL